MRNSRTALLVSLLVAGWSTGGCASNPGIGEPDLGSDAAEPDAASDGATDAGMADGPVIDSGCREAELFCAGACAACPANAVVATSCAGSLCVATECASGFVLSSAGACVEIGEIAQQAYVKASNTAAADMFGWAISLSADGSTMAVGAPFESSSASGVGGDQANDDMPSSGAVYLFVRSGETWTQQAYIKASNPNNNDAFGTAVALSQDGSTLAVGAHGERSSATGIGGNQADNTAEAAGAVYVFVRAGTTWTQQAYVKAVNTGAGDTFGTVLALSNAGTTMAVGAPREDSNGSFADNSLEDSGAVYLFSRSGVTWTQAAYLKGPNHDAGDFFGLALALSGDGATIAIGAPVEASNATGVGGDSNNNDYALAGATYVFTRQPDSSWSFEAYIKASNTDANDAFGQAVALSIDGNMLAVGAGGEQSNGDGVGSDESSNTATQSGAAYVFTRTGTAWAQQAYVKAARSDAHDQFGQSLAFNSNGTVLAVGAAQESGGSTGVGGDETDNTEGMSGAVYLFARDGTIWSQQAYIKASNANQYDNFGQELSLSNDGRTLVVAAPSEASAATGVGGLELDNSFSRSGATYVFGY